MIKRGGGWGASGGMGGNRRGPLGGGTRKAPPRDPNRGQSTQEQRGGGWDRGSPDSSHFPLTGQGERRHVGRKRGRGGELLNNNTARQADCVQN